MPTIAGYRGNATFSSLYTAHIHAWSADVVCEALEDTAWQGGPTSTTKLPSLPWRTYIPGLRAFTGSYECYMDSAVVPTLGDGDAHQVRLYVDGDTYLEGMAIITGIHPTAPIEGMQSVTIDFQGSFDLRTVGTTTPGPTTTPAPTTTTTAVPTTTTTAP